MATLHMVMIKYFNLWPLRPYIFKRFAFLHNDTVTNNKMITCQFPNKLKYGDITPAYKNEDSTNIRNYRPVSLLPAVSKLFERVYYLIK